MRVSVKSGEFSFYKPFKKFYSFELCLRCSISHSSANQTGIYDEAKALMGTSQHQV